MEMEYKQEVNDSYLILKQEEGTEEESFQLRMIIENNIAGLLRAEKRNFNNESRIYYHIGGSQSLMQLQNKKEADAKMLRRLLIEIDTVLNTLSQYLLDADSLLLIPECIYFSGEEERISFCLYPYEKRDIRQQFRELSEYFLERINRADEQAVGLAFQLYRMTREPNFVFSEIVEKLAHKEGIRPVENESGNNQVQSYEEPRQIKECTEDEKAKDELKPAPQNAGKRKIRFLGIALTIGSFLYLLYVYAIKQYYYGYSFKQIFGTREAVLAFFMFVFFLLISILLSHRLDGEKGKSL